MTLCRQNGIDVKNQLSTIEPEVRDQVVQLVQKQSSKPAVPPPGQRVVPSIPPPKVRVLDDRPKVPPTLRPVQKPVTAPAEPLDKPSVAPATPAAAEPPVPPSERTAPPMTSAPAAKAVESAPLPPHVTPPAKEAVPPAAGKTVEPTAHPRPEQPSTPAAVTPAHSGSRTAAPGNAACRRRRPSSGRTSARRASGRADAQRDARPSLGRQPWRHAAAPTDGSGSSPDATPQSPGSAAVAAKIRLPRRRRSHSRPGRRSSPRSLRNCSIAPATRPSRSRTFIAPCSRRRPARSCPSRPKTSTSATMRTSPSPGTRSLIAAPSPVWLAATNATRPATPARPCARRG